MATTAPGTEPKPPPLNEMQRNNTNTITIPGIQDIIAIRPLESQALYWERLKRMKESNSALPQALNWVPKLIGILDDAQDLLFTALVLSKPIIKRLPARFIPGVGWLLLVNDVLNLGVWAAGTLLNGPTGKAKLARTLDAWTGGASRNFNQLLRGKISPLQAARNVGKNLSRNVDTFVKGNHKFGAIIQGAQAAYTISSWAGKKAQELGIIDPKPAHWNAGVGLQLGSVMGAVTDTVWAGVKGIQGEKWEIVPPPKNDIATKAARYMLNSTNANTVQDVLSPEDHALLMAANAVAASVLSEATTTSDYIARFDHAADQQPPTFRIWNPTSKAALREWGYNPDIPTGTLAPLPSDNRTILGQATYAAKQQAGWEAGMARVFQGQTLGSVLQVLNTQAGSDFIGAAVNAGDPGHLALAPQEAIEMRIVEWNMFPISWPSQDRAEQLLNRGDLDQYAKEFNPGNAWQNMLNELAGQLTLQLRVNPTPDQVKAALVRHFGGYQAR